MASLDRDLAEFHLAPIGKRRSLLLSIARSGANLPLGAFGGDPADAVPHVVDMDGDVQVTSRASGLMLAARSLGMEVHDPVAKQDASGSVASYEVWFEAEGAAQVLSSAESEADATAAACAQLETLVGTLVVPLHDWVTGQMHAGFETSFRR